MRIAILTHSNRIIGGAESYVSQIVPHLIRSGIEIGFWHELDTPVDRITFTINDSCPAWCVSKMGLKSALRSLVEWKPDIVFANGLSSPVAEEMTQRITRSILDAHTYVGTCISGMKTFKRPLVVPCERTFGKMCLACFFPRRCGGRNPITMWRDYLRQKMRFALLGHYETIVVHSKRMEREFLNHGTPGKRIACIPLFVDPPESMAPSTARHEECPWRIIFVGRMDYLKGGHILIESLPALASQLDQHLELTLMGDGPMRHTWEQIALRVQAQCGRIKVFFTGWLDQSQLRSRLTQSDLLAIPSLWPEPFGLVGLEAGRFGVPAAGFATGGIPDWLKEGVNGHLASASPPTIGGLSQAMAKCLSDPNHYNRLRQGAQEMVRQFGLERHLRSLLQVLKA